MEKNFKELGICDPILKAIDEMGFVSPTEVQEQAIPYILNGKDLVVMSKTGSGKTAVFGISMLNMIDACKAGPQALILTPTRELAVQVDSDLKKFSKFLPHKTTAVYGQHSINTEITVLKKGPSIVTGTPGRVFDHIEHGNLITTNIRFLVLDEADRMLDMGFIDQVEKIIRALPKDRITLLFSATIPDEIKRICSKYMKSPEKIEIESQTKTVDLIDQIYYRVNYNEKNTWLNRLLLVEQPESCMIFCNTKLAVDRVQNFLTRKGYSCQALHGDVPQGKRISSIDKFKRGEFHLLVATDVAARGIHIEGLSHVINYDVPNEKDSYVHRIGRTGRAGKTGRAITFVTGDDIMSLYDIEEHIGALINEESLPTLDVFNERNAEAEAWIKSNAIRHEANNQNRSHQANSSKSRTYSNKTSVTSSTQQTSKTNGTRSNNTRSNSSRNNSARNNSPRSNSPTSYDTKGNNIRGNNTGSSNTRKNSSIRSITVNTSNVQNSSYTNRSATQTKPVNATENTSKKASIFKRILQNIFGKH